MKKSKKTKKIMKNTGKIKKDQINDNCLHMRLDSPNHVTTRRNGQQSVQFEIMIFSNTQKITRTWDLEKIVAEAIFLVKFLRR